MIDRREFMSGAAAFATLGLRASCGDPFLRTGRSPSRFDLPADPTPEEIETLRRKWSYWMDPPDGYAFKKEARLVKRYSYSKYDAEIYLQRNGPEEWHWQRVLKVFPKKIEKPLATVAIPFYFVEAMLGHELDDESAVLPKFTEVAQAAQLAKRGYMAITCDMSYVNYLKHEVSIAKPGGSFIEMSYKLAEDWPMWNAHAHRVYVTRLMLDLLDDDPRVDKSRIGMTGHSLGGQTGIHAGCLDPRVKSVMLSDFGLDFDQTCWNVLHYWAGKLPAVRADGLENHTALTVSGGTPVCVIGGLYDDVRTLAEMGRAKGYRSHPQDLLSIHHAAGHRPPQWALEEGYKFLDRTLGVTPKETLT